MTALTLTTELVLAATARSESDRPHEWPAIMWAIRNRKEDGRYPSTYLGVCTQPRQFSAYNDLLSVEPEDKVEELLERFSSERDGLLLQAAAACATWVLATPREGAPFGPKVLWFWSPRSMNPPGRSPTWADPLRKVFVPGIDPWRFTFAEELPEQRGKYVR